MLSCYRCSRVTCIGSHPREPTSYILMNLQPSNKHRDDSFLTSVVLTHSQPVLSNIQRESSENIKKKERKEFKFQCQIQAFMAIRGVKVKLQKLLSATSSPQLAQRKGSGCFKTTNLFVCLDNKLSQPPVNCPSGHCVVKGDDIDVENHLFCFCFSLLSHSCPWLFFLCQLPSCCLSSPQLHPVKSCCACPCLFFFALFLSLILFVFNPSLLILSSPSLDYALHLDICILVHVRLHRCVSVWLFSWNQAKAVVRLFKSCPMNAAWTKWPDLSKSWAVPSGKLYTHTQQVDKESIQIRDHTPPKCVIQKYSLTGATVKNMCRLKWHYSPERFCVASFFLFPFF